eukprot:67219-Hanusia_phi.AAC.1
MHLKIANLISLQQTSSTLLPPTLLSPSTAHSCEKSREKRSLLEDRFMAVEAITASCPRADGRPARGAGGSFGVPAARPGSAPRPGGHAGTDHSTTPPGPAPLSVAFGPSEWNYLPLSDLLINSLPARPEAVTQPQAGEGAGPVSRRVHTGRAVIGPDGDRLVH